MHSSPGLHDRDGAASDDASASEARQRLRERGIVPVEPDERIGVLLAVGEQVVAVRRAISIERRTEAHGPDAGVQGDLYVTTARILCLGAVHVDLPLADIQEAVVAPGALRLVVGAGRGVEIRTADPSLLRVEISAVREAARQMPAR